MSELVATKGGEVFALPTFSTELQGWLWQDVDGARFGMDWIDGEGISLSRLRSKPTAALVREAAAAHIALKRAVEPPGSGLMAQWLQLLSVVRNPPEARSVASVARLFAAALSDYPAGAFTAATQRRAAVTFKFWPSAADVAELVEPEAREIRRALRVTGYLANLKIEGRS